MMAYAAVRTEFERVEAGKKMFREKIASKWHRCAFATSVAALIAHGQAAANFEIALLECHWLRRLPVASDTITTEPRHQLHVGGGWQTNSGPNEVVLGVSTF